MPEAIVLDLTLKWGGNEIHLSSLPPINHHISQIYQLLFILAALTRLQVTITWINLLSALPSPLQP